jgi:hypothetical protein
VRAGDTQTWHGLFEPPRRLGGNPRPCTEQEGPPAFAGTESGKPWHQVAARHPLLTAASLAAHRPDHADSVGKTEVGSLEHGAKGLIGLGVHHELRIHGYHQPRRCPILYQALDVVQGRRHVQTVDADAQDAEAGDPGMIARRC